MSLGRLRMTMVVRMPLGTGPMGFDLSVGKGLAAGVYLYIYIYIERERECERERESFDKHEQVNENNSLEPCCWLRLERGEGPRGGAPLFTLSAYARICM